jgi:hypothetical protein
MRNSMSLLEQFAGTHGLRMCMMKIQNRIHFNPATFPGRAPEDQVSYEPAIEGRPDPNDPEDTDTLKLYIASPDNPASDYDTPSPTELVILRWDSMGVNTYPFDTADATVVAKVLRDVGLKGRK